MLRFPAAAAVCLAQVLAVVAGSAPSAFASTASTKPKSVSLPQKDLDAILQAVQEASAYVEGVRKQKFTSKPKVEVLAGAAFVARLRSEQASDPTYERDLKRLGQMLDALGLVNDTKDARVVLDAILDSGVAGFYDPETDVLVVKGGKISPLVRTILVHELTHALDDQRHDLDRPEMDDVTDGSDEAFVFLVEGTARWVENAYRNSRTAAERREMDAEELRQVQQSGALLRVASNPAYANALPFLITNLLAPYELGKQMVADLVAAEGTEGLEKAFANPPTTAEQGRSYASFARREAAIPVTRPPHEGTLLYSGVFGEASLNALLTSLGDLGGDLRVSTAAKGWGGDQFVLYQPKTGGPCLRLDLAMDTAADLREAEAALKTWAAAHANASVRKQRDDVLRVTACG